MTESAVRWKPGAGAGRPDSREADNREAIVREANPDAPRAARAVPGIDRWLARQAAREARIVLLEEALLANRLWRYGWFRLRFFLVTYLVASVTHAVHAVLLVDGLAGAEVALVVAAHGVVLLVAHLWWGALEALRGEVRDLHRAGKPHRIPAAIGGWVALSLLLAAAMAALATAWLGWRASTGRLDVTAVYVAVLLLRLVIDIPLRALHSGVYALRRVYKPMWATVVPELAGLAVLLALVPVVGLWAVVASLAVGGALSSALTAHYTRRLYHFLGLRPRPTVALCRRSLRAGWREAVVGGAAHALIGLDGLVVLGLLAAAGPEDPAVVVLFLALPTVTAGAEWARLLYFDLKRLELRLFTNLRRRFEAYTQWLALVLGLLFFAVAALVAAVFATAGATTYLGLAAFFLARSALARTQIQAFAERAYPAVLATGAACVVGLLAVGALASDGAGRLGGMALVTAVCAAALWRPAGGRARAAAPTAVLTMEWLRRLGQVRDEVRIGSARMAAAPGPAARLDARTREEAARWRLAQLAERVARRLGHDGVATWVGPDRVVWLEHVGPQQRISAGWLQRASGGLVTQLRSQVCPDGEQAIRHAAATGMLGWPSADLQTVLVPVDRAAARRRFRALVPTGAVYAADEPPPAMVDLPGAELRAILADATAFARDLAVRRRRSRFDITVLCAGGELDLIFIADRGTGRRARARWHRLVRSLNLRAAVAGVSARGGIDG